MLSEVLGQLKDLPEETSVQLTAQDHGSDNCMSAGKFSRVRTLGTLGMVCN